MKKKMVSVFASLAVATASVAVLGSCGNNNTTPSSAPVESTKEEVVVNENQIYYCETESGEVFVSLNGNKVTAYFGKQTYFGTITKENDKLVFTLDGTGVTLVATGDVLKLTVGGEEFVLRKREAYTVTFSVDGNAVGTKNVINGKAVDSLTAPAKEGYAFVGWYLDQDFTVQYDFANTPVYADVTLYGRYVELSVGAQEYTVTVVDGEATTTTTTENGVCYNLPVKSDSSFVGWYVALDGDATKTTYEYKGQKLTESTTIVAVYKSENIVVSVDGNKISWDNVKQGAVYSVRVEDSNGTVVFDTKESGTSTTFNFENSGFGVYTVSVTSEGKTGVAYYKNRVLAKVSNAKVIAPNVFVFDPVEGATRYSITVTCGNEAHNHVNYNLGKNTYFDFEGCTMIEGGIKFVVTAYANGYKESISEEFVYDMTLDKPTVAVDGDEVVWDRVDGAYQYVVEVAQGENFTKVYVGNANSYDLRYYTGELKVTVYPVRDGYNSQKTTVEVNKTNLAAPYGLQIEGNTVSWQAVEGAKSYNLKINDTVIEVTEGTSYTVSKDEIPTNTSEFYISVQAVAEEAANNSNYSYASVVTRTLTDVDYVNGLLVWDAVFGASKYAVSVNGGTEVEVTDNKYQPKLTMAGNNTLTVAYYDEAGVRYPDKTITVFAEELRFDVVDGDGKVETLYKVVGDSVILPTPESKGLTFAGWYTLPNGPKAGGVKVDNVFKMPSKTVILYAYWTNKPYKVTLNPGLEGTLAESDTEKVVTFRENYKLPVPTVTDPTTMAFIGWRTQPNGGGILVTDENGASLSYWGFPEDTTLYPDYEAVVDYVEIEGTDELMANPGAGAAFTKEIRIGATHNGKKVTQLGKFASLSNVTKLYIPDTIETIDTVLSLSGLTYLEAIEMYDPTPETPHEVKYKSYEGVLYTYEETSDYTGYELSYLPSKYNGILNVMPGAVAVGAKACKSNYKITKVVIPASVKYIGESAFESSYKILAIEFEDPKEGEEAVDLVIASNAFKGDYYFTYIELPARLKEFDASIFTSCSALEKVVVREGNENYVSKNGMVCGNNGTELLFCPKGIVGEVVIPEGVTVIKSEVFKSYTKITKVVVPGNVTLIENSAFYGCSGITELVFEGDEEDLTLEIQEQAFYSCSGLTELTLAPNVRKIAKNAFGSTTKLVTVNVLSNGTIDFATGVTSTATTTSNGSSYVQVLNIGKNTPVFDVNGVFGSSLDKLKEINVDAENPYFASVDGVLFDKEITRLLFYPQSTRTEYQLPDTVTEIGSGAFQKRTYLEKFTIGKNVEVIGDNAFNGCSSIKELVFEADREKELTIGINAFRSLTSLTSIVLPDKLTKIGDYAFYGVNKLTEIIIPEGVTEIGDYSFQSCTSLVRVVLPSTLEKFGTFDPTKEDSTITSFESNSKLTNLEISAENPTYATSGGIVYLKEEAVITQLLFCPIGVVGDVVVPKTVNFIRNKAFYNNKNVTSLSFEDHMSAATKNEAGEYVQGTLVLGNKTDKINSVSQIVTDVFYYCQNLKSVELPGITTIPGKLFYYCSKLESFKVPNTVEYIGNQAFSYCNQLKTIEFEEGNEDTELVIFNGTAVSSSSSSIYSAFGNCGITSIKLPNRVKRIGNQAFRELTNLKEVILPESLEEIGQYAFYNCKGLGEVDLSKTKVKKIDNYGFYSCQIKKLVLSNTLQTLGTTAFGYNLIEELTIPASVTTLGGSAFTSNKYLTKLTFAEGSKLTEIGSTCFSYSQISEVSLPASLQKIQANAFSNCSKLAHVGFEGENVSVIGNQAFSNTALTEFAFPIYRKSGKVTKYTTLGTSVFTGCKLLKKVSISASVKSLDNVFTGANAIEVMEAPQLTGDDLKGTVQQSFAIADDNTMVLSSDKKQIVFIYKLLAADYKLPEGITTISSNAFKNQTLIKSLVIPATVNVIGNYAFSNCRALESVVFEEGSAISGFNSNGTTVNTFGQYVFDQCSSLKSVTLPEKLTVVPKYMFNKCKLLETVSLPSTVKSIDDSAFSESGLKSIVLPEACTTIGASSFAKCYDLESIDISNVTTIGNSAFRYDTKITSITLSSKVTKVGTYCFADCTGLTKAVIPGSVGANLGYDCFYQDTNLSEVILEEGVTKIDTSTFFGCTALQKIDLPSTIETIGSSSFAKSGLTEFTVPAKVKTFNATVLQNCVSLTKFVNKATALTKLGDQTFDGCTALTNVDLGTVLTYINQRLFQGCTALETVDLPSTVKVIGNYAFKDSGIKNITLPANLVSIGGTSDTQKTVYSSAYTFQNCVNLQSVTFTSPNTFVGGYVFSNCSALKEVNFGTGTTLGGSVFENSGIERVDLTNIIAAGNYTFDKCALLEDVILPNNMTELPTYSFRNCTSLKSINLPATLTVLNANCFQGSGLEKVDLSNITYLGGYAFDGCESLTEVKMMTTLKTIGNYVFRGCSSLEELAFPRNLGFVPAGFVQNTAIKSVTIPAMTTKINSNAFAGCENLSEVIILGKIALIDDGAFEDCKSLTDFKIPDTCEEIGDGAFENSGITEIYIPEKCVRMGSNPFIGLKNLKKFTVDEANPSFRVDEFGALIDMDIDTVVSYPTTAKATEYTVAEGLTVGSYAFAGSSVKKVICEKDSLVEKYAFGNADMLEEIVLPEGMTEVPSYLAPYTSNLNTIIIPNTVTTINSYAFQYSGVKRIEIPASVETINTYTFRGCERLEEVILHEGLKTINGYVFVESGLKTINIPSTVETIANYAFQKSALTEISFPSTLKKIGAYVLDASVNLTKVTFEDGFTDLATISGTTSSCYWFRGCTSLEEINIPEGVTTLPYGFADSTAIKSITLPTTLRTLPAYCFRGCVNLETVDLSHLTVDGFDAKTYIFADSGIKTITIPDGWTNIPGYTFKGCKNLETVVLPDSIEKISNYCFLESGLKSMVVPKNVTVIETNLFKDCAQLESLTILGEITIVYGGAFDNLTSLKELKLNVSNIQTFIACFRGWTAEQKVYFNNSKGMLGSFAYADGSEATFVYDCVF